MPSTIVKMAGTGTQVVFNFEVTWALAAHAPMLAVSGELSVGGGHWQLAARGG
jgi:hypothetical protein